MKLSSIFILTSMFILAVGCSGEKTNSPAKDENQVIEAIMARRSIRQYKDQPVEREKLELIAQCGINAPNGLNRQPWEVRIVDNPDFINGITEVFLESDTIQSKNPEFKNMFRNAPAVIFIASPRDGSGQLDCGLLGENIVLAAHSLGLGSCCLGGPVRFITTDQRAQPYLERLDFSDDYQLLYAIGIGYPDEAPDAKPRDSSKIKFVD